MAARFQFEHSLDFAPAHATETLRSIPTLPGVFALRGSDPNAQPYLTRAADLRRRITRLLAPPEPSVNGAPASQSKRLNLSSRVARIDYTVAGSDFESTLALYHLSAQIFGLEEARRRLKLRTPFFLRFAAENNYPRLYTTNRLSRRALANIYGPFPSRAAADRYCEAVEDLFLLRRCHEELHPAPDHPGCIYGEMGKCLAPCNQAQIPANAHAYAAEAAAVEAFLNTRGESLLAKLAAEREQASTDLDFERAAELHAQIQKVKAAVALADPLVQPIPRLRVIIVQKSAQIAAHDASPSASPLLSFRSRPKVSSGPARSDAGAAEESASVLFAEPTAALFLLHSGCLIGPTRLSTLGVRAVREQTAVGSSLFAQPLMLSAIPLADDAEPAALQPTTNTVIPSEERSDESRDPEAAHPASTARTVLPTLSSAPDAALNPESRAAAAIASLEAQASALTDLTTLSDHLSLLRRWYYRPEKQRAGEVFLSREDGTWPLRRILRGAARLALGEPTTLPEVRRNLAQRNPADTLPSRLRTPMIDLCFSILASDFAHLADEVAAATRGGGSIVHVDVMDGHFVPNITFGPPMVKALRPITKLPLDCHLMIENPDTFIPAFAEAGADMISVHQEVCPHLHRTLQLIAAHNVLSGVVINPATPVETLIEVLPMVHHVLVMSVNPGFGGQQFLPLALDKIALLAELRSAMGLRYRIQVDGGVDKDTVAQVVQAGAEMLVAGSAVFERGRAERNARELLRRARAADPNPALAKKPLTPKSKPRKK